MAEEPTPTEMPDEELLYDLADLFKVFSDTTPHQDPLRPHGPRALRRGHRRGDRQHAERGLPPAAHLKQARLVRFQRDGRNVLYSLADDHVYTMLSQGMSHICE